MRAILILILAVLCAACDGPDPSSDAEIQSARTWVESSLASGAVTALSCIGDRAQINPVVWSADDIDHKRTMTRMLAIYCEAEGGQPRERHITVMDAQSGKRLSSYDTVHGVRLF